jgi:hypothetical protein
MVEGLLGGISAQPYSGSISPAAGWLARPPRLYHGGVVVVFGDESDGFLHNYLYNH